MSEGPKDYGAHWEWIKTVDPHLTGPTGGIQWKGTDVCMDVHCKCGKHTHIDDDFTYYIECGECGAIYQVSQNISLNELPPEQAEFVRRDRPNVIKVST